jgi:UDP-N-acetylmuramoyl-tripeptide--D-alanyl-D-alanine ligase
LNDLKDYHEILIAEIGAYEKGKIKEVCKMIRPQIGILTGINDQHLGTFGSQENIVKAKFELIDSLPENGTAIFNWDSDLVRREVVARKLKTKYKRCSVQGVADFFARSVEPYRDYLTFKLYERTGESSQIQVNLLGSQNAVNIILAAACAKELGLTLNEISRGCFNIKPSQGGIVYTRKISPIVIDATYSSNLDGVLADLEYLKLQEGRKVVIMPCLIELDGNSLQDHERIGEKIAEVCDLAIITSKECLGAIQRKFPKAVYLESPEKITEKAKKFDVIFLEGRVPKKVIDYLK